MLKLQFKLGPILFLTAGFGFISFFGCDQKAVQLPLQEEIAVNKTDSLDVETIKTGAIVVEDNKMIPSQRYDGTTPY